MRVLALLSGGKDSVCAVETVRGWGWDVVAAMALHPASDDAWMFHTPNLGAVRAVAAGLGLPLVEAPVRSGQEEEVVDLEAAIATLHGQIPFDGIVSGALASEYQKTRIDAIGHRLGLKTFAPLWHKEPRAYVDSLLAAGWDIRFSRVAAEGVPKAWAGTQLDAKKVEAMARHPARPHVAGEGGEYETLVLWAPGWKERVTVSKARTEESAGRATWIVEEWELRPHVEGVQIVQLPLQVEGVGMAPP